MNGERDFFLLYVDVYGSGGLLMFCFVFWQDSWLVVLLPEDS